MKNRLKYMMKQNMLQTKNLFSYFFCKLRNPVSDNLIMFEAYNGTAYADSVKAIYEELLKDENYRSFYFVWAFEQPEKYKFLLNNNHTILVRKNTYEYNKYYSRSRFWINNVTVENYLKPRNNQIYIETWNGTPIKKIGRDISYDSNPLLTKKLVHKQYQKRGKKVSFFPAPSDYYINTIKSAFKIDDDSKFLKVGYPRNDILFNADQATIDSIKNKLNIPNDKKIILYTPTLRETNVDKNGKYPFKNPTNLDQIMENLGPDYVMLYRAHQNNINETSFSSNRIINVNYVDDVEDLYLVSDMLITDYSSTMFDFSILHKPIIFHMYDMEEYENNIRGLYINQDELFGPITHTNEELTNAIKDQFENFEYNEKYKAFNEKYNQYEKGSAAKELIRTCMKEENHKKDAFEKLVRYTMKTTNRIYLVFQIIKYNLGGFFHSRGLFLNNNSLRLASLKNIHKGKRCFLIGNGPSLTGEDLNLLQNEYTFGTNMVYKIFDQTDWRPSYHCISDTIYGSKLGEELSNKVKAPLFTTERTYRKMKRKPVDTTYVNTIQSERYKVRGNIHAYCMVKATVLSLAAEMAFHMGFTEIYLLGVDCTNPHAKGGHFTDNYTTKEVAETDINRIKERMNKKSLTTDQIGNHIIDRSMEVYELLNQYAKKHNIKIYNATRGGNLEIFPRVNLEDVLGIKS